MASACAQVTDKFKDRLVDEGFNPTYGARPLRRAIMRLIEDCLSERILTGDIKVRRAQLCAALFVQGRAVCGGTLARLGVWGGCPAWRLASRAGPG